MPTRLYRAGLAGLVICGLVSACSPQGEAETSRSTPALPGETGEATSTLPGANATLMTPEPSPTSEPPGIDPALAATLPDVTLEVDLHYYDRWMSVRQLVEMQNTSPGAWTEVVFSVPVNTAEGAFYLNSLRISVGEDSEDALPYFPPGENILRVDLPRAAAPGDTIRIEMQYNVVIQPVAKTDVPPTGLTGWTVEVIQAGEWYPALVPYVEGEGWMSWPYHPVGDPFVYALANYDLVVQTEDSITVASGGPQAAVSGLPGQGEDGAWRFHVEGGRGIAFFASDRYEIAAGDAGGVPVYSYYFPEHRQAGQAALEIAVQSIPLYAELFGDYPYTGLVIAENGFAGGMEYSALISISDFVYFTYPGEAPSVLHALTSHEVAHQWWYGAVGSDQVYEPWLDESLAFYSELLYLERYYPDLVDWWWQVQVYQYNLFGPADPSIYSFAYTADYVVSVYGQAAQFLRDLRALMGDEAFFAFMRDYYATYQWQMATAADFFSIVRRHTDQDITPLLQTYFVHTTP